ncbi:MAG: hypothetical protein JEZ10_08275 [Verrucomicrobia bacterium]|nr:hypothetical protein [Verrucomicrobiota bacterium]
MKENRRYKRFDLFSTLAVLGTVAVLLFECVFVFELYTRTVEPLERFLPSVEDPALPESVELTAPVG